MRLLLVAAFLVAFFMSPTAVAAPAATVCPGVSVSLLTKMWISRFIPPPARKQTSVRKQPRELAGAMIAVLKEKFPGKLASKDMDSVTLIANPFYRNKIYVILSKNDCVISASGLGTKQVQHLILLAQKRLA